MLIELDFISAHEFRLKPDIIDDHLFVKNLWKLIISGLNRKCLGEYNTCFWQQAQQVRSPQLDLKTWYFKLLTYFRALPV